MNGELKYGDVALGVEAALPALRPRERLTCRYTRFRRTIIWLYAVLKRWA